jgi:hypothetical protein
VDLVLDGDRQRILLAGPQCAPRGPGAD